MVLASVILTIKDVAIPLSEVGLHYAALLVRYKFPLRATYYCQPLRHVTSPTVSEYYGLIRLPAGHRSLSFPVQLSYPSMMGTYRFSQVAAAYEFKMRLQLSGNA